MKTPILILLVGVAAACAKGGDQPAGKDIGAQTSDITSDTDVARLANAAAGDVVRAAGDCDAVRAALPEAQRKLDELQAKIRTVTGKTTVEAIRKRVHDIAEACGG
jgi:hypothetical protein